MCVNLHQGNLDLIASIQDVVKQSFRNLTEQWSWLEYVAGSIPSNRESVLRTRMDGNGGSPHVTWTPDLGTARVYSVAGKTNLADGAWGETNGASRFFKVRVTMP